MVKLGMAPMSRMLAATATVAALISAGAAQAAIAPAKRTVRREKEWGTTFSVLFLFVVTGS